MILMGDWCAWMRHLCNATRRACMSDGLIDVLAMRATARIQEDPVPIDSGWLMGDRRCV